METIIVTTVQILGILAVGVVWGFVAEAIKQAKR